MVQLDASKFDMPAFMRTLDAELSDGRHAVNEPAWRIARTRNDPLAFALLYLAKHLASDATGGAITLSDAHLAWRARAMSWADGKPKVQHEDRHAEIAPRETGKSTWWFLVIPLWSAAHGHNTFTAAFADTTKQAQTHLETFRKELETNARLREDFPALCDPLQRGTRRQSVSDNRGMIQQANGFIFAATGIDAGALGMKVGEKRPDVILLDDIEPGEDGYSLEQMKKRRSTITDVVFPLNSFARVTITGTVTMPGSITHQLVNKAKGIVPDDPENSQWIDDEHIQPHHYPAIIERDDGTERSIWPARWSLEFLLSIRHTRSYAKNFANDPKGNDGDYWTMDDYIYGPVLGIARTLLEIDPAITTKASSDYTGLAVIGYSPLEKRVLVKWAKAVKLSPANLRQYLLDVVFAEFPEIGLVRVETNQGGDTWKAILHDLPVGLKTVHNNVPKEIRAASNLNHYQRGRVVHAKGLTALEEQQVTFPKAPNDDLVDAVGDGCAYFLNPPKKTKPGGRNVRYV